MSAHDTTTAGEPVPREYLNLNRIGISELPPHPDFPAQLQETRISLVQFLNALFAEVSRADFDAGWTSQGKWHPEGEKIAMPVLSSNEMTGDSAPDAAKSTAAENQNVKMVPVSVEQRVKTMQDKNTWTARTSYHLESHIKYTELDELVSQEHSLNECRYTPSVYDANELLSWSAQDLGAAVTRLSAGLKIQGVQMSIFQMFHKMPEVVAGLSLLQDRVFHVLVVTAHSSYPSHAAPGTPYSFTAQLPIDFDSLKGSDAIMQRSHTKTSGSSRRYHLPSTAATGTAQPTEEQKKRVGKKLTEGIYVSLERLQKASKDSPTDETSAPASPPMDIEHYHRWDMMTLSTAKGITDFAPESTKQKEILKAIATDVEYVIRHAAETRRRKTTAQ